MPLSITTLEPFNLNNSATFTFASTSVTANIVAGNLKTDNLLYANGVAWSFVGSYSNTNVASYLPTYSGLVGGTLSTGAQPNITSVGTLTSLTSGLITATSGGIKVGNLQDPSGTNTVQLSSGSITVTGNITAGGGGSGNVTATYFIGNGSQLTGLTSSYSNTNVAAYLPTYSGLVGGTLSTASQPNITSVGTLTNLTVTSNISASNISGNTLTLTGNISTGTGTGNISGANYVIANYFQGNGSLLTGLPASYSNTNTAAYLATYTGNVAAGNVLTNNLLYANGTAWTFSSYSNTNVAAYLPTYTGNFTAGNANIATSLVVGNSITTGAGTGNISGANYVVANYFSGNGSLLSSLTAGNISGQVSNSLISGTVYSNAQPNITSVGSLASLTVSGDATITGNLTISGNYNYVNVSTLNIKDPVIELGGNPNGTALTTNDGYDRGTLLHYYTTSAIDAFMGWKNSGSEFIFASNASISANVVTVNNYGNVHAGYFIGNGSQLTGVVGSANYATYAGTVLTNAQPNITSTGTLTSLNVTGNVSSGGNVIGNGQYLTSLTGGNVTGYVPLSTAANTAGTVTTGAQPNITSTGTLASLNVTGNVSSGGNIIGNGQYLTSIAGGNVTGQVANALLAGTVYVAAQPNITSLGTLVSTTIAANSNITMSGSLSQITGANTISGTYLTGTLTTASQPNITSTGTLVSTTIAANSNITMSGSLSQISGANLLSGTYLTGTLTTSAQPNITSTGTLASLTVTANVTAGNLKTDNLLYSNGTAWSFGSSSYSNSNVASYLPTYTGNVAAGNVLTDNLRYANGVAWSFGGGSGTPGGSNTQIQFNDSNSFGGSANLTFDKGTKTLSADKAVFINGGNLGSNISNLYIGGGGVSQILATDGSGNLTWVAQPVATITVDNFTGDGSTTAFTLSTTPTNINQTIVNYNGAFQLRTTAYTLSGPTITFTEAPSNGSLIEVTTTVGSTSGAGAFVTRTYTGTGSQTNFTVTSGVTVSSVLVTENGLVQTPTTDYTISGSTLTFTTAPSSGVSIQIRELAIAVATTVSPAYRQYTGNGVANTFTITSGLTANSLIVAENGILQRPTVDYSVSGSNVVFVTTPASNVDIQIRELSLNGGMSTGGISLPYQGGNSGKYLTTDGATASWANVTSTSIGKTVALNMFLGGF